MLGVRLRVGELGNMTIYSGFSLDRKPDQFRCYRPYDITTAGTNGRQSSHGLGGFLDELNLVWSVSFRYLKFEGG